jgi:hypothetical protein
MTIARVLILTCLDGHSYDAYQPLRPTGYLYIFGGKIPPSGRDGAWKMEQEC